MTVRLATADDCIEIQKIASIEWSRTYFNIYSKEQISKFINKSYDLKNLVDSLQEPNSCMYVALKRGRIVGFAQSSFRRMGFELRRIYILKEAQRGGIGKELLAAVENFGVSLGAVEIWTQTHENNFAHFFFRKQGFKDMGPGEEIGIILLKKFI